MDEMEEQRVRQWIRNWEEAAPVLDRLRDEAIRNSDTAKAIEQLSDAFESATCGQIRYLAQRTSRARSIEPGPVAPW